VARASSTASFADGVEEAGVDEVTVAIDHVDRGELRIGRATVACARLVAGRTREGALSVPIFDLVPALATPTPAPTPPVLAAGDVPPFVFTLAKLGVEQASVSFADQAVEPRVDLAGPGGSK
jgi:hypothetical protein